MSRVCEICGKGKMDGKTVSHANNKAPRKYEVNLQETIIDGKRVRACTKCIKNAKKDA
ncbi:MAG: 50S ribosomal protein L28 [Clostridia bacterium]|nr:50S ribosomal protein L28 [Clostridia bacterium]